MQHVVKPENKTRLWSAMFYLEDTIGGVGDGDVSLSGNSKRFFRRIYAFPFWTSFRRFSCDLPKFGPVTPYGGFCGCIPPANSVIEIYERCDWPLNVVQVSGMKHLSMVQSVVLPLGCKTDLFQLNFSCS